MTGVIQYQLKIEAKPKEDANMATDYKILVK